MRENTHEEGGAASLKTSKRKEEDERQPSQAQTHIMFSNISHLFGSI